MLHPDPLNTDNALRLDPYSGNPGFIHGGTVSAGERTAGAALNRRRAAALELILAPDVGEEPVSPDGWASAVARATG